MALERQAAPAVSVVIPLHNGAAYVEDTIRSVLCQTIRELEVIVVDDGSTDGSSAVVERVSVGDGRVSLHRFENAGAAVARNRGLALARGEFVAFLDHDDVWYEHKLERQLEIMRQRPTAGVVGCVMRYVGASGRQLGTTGHVPDPIDQAAVRAGRLTPFATCSAALFRTGLVRQVGGFVDLFGPGATLAEDLHLYALVARSGEVICVREALGAYRVHQTAARSEASLLFGPAVEYVRYALADPSFPKRVGWERFKAEYRPSRSELREQLAQASYRAGAVALLERRWTAAARGIGRALMLRPRFTAGRALRQLRRR